MKRLICIAYFLAAIGISASASADGIAHWVDADGVAHYGNPQFAPAGESNLIEVADANIMVAAANIMDVPVAPPAQSRSPGFVRIRHQHKMNKRTWQGSRVRNLRRTNLRID